MADLENQLTVVANGLYNVMNQQTELSSRLADLQISVKEYEKENKILEKQYRILLNEYKKFTFRKHVD